MHKKDIPMTTMGILTTKKGSEMTIKGDLDTREVHMDDCEGYRDNQRKVSAN